MKHTPKRPAHHWVITTVDGVETGKCRICKATRIFDPERTRYWGAPDVQRVVQQ